MSGAERPAASRVAVTGAGGMLGRELVREAAARGVDLVAWDRAGADVTDADAVRRAVTAAFTRIARSGSPSGPTWTAAKAIPTARCA